MLSFFPTPYPDEWWYSVLCRYHLRTGCTDSDTKKLLYRGSTSAHMGTLFPNGTVAEVVQQLPKDLFDIREIILYYTPFLYYTRMYPREEREAMLRGLCAGETVQLTHLWRSYNRASWSPRYCPVCAKEDEACYGEPYWHTDHQIPLMTVCPRHKCRLLQIKLDSPQKALNDRFYLLSEIIKEEPDYTVKPWEKTVSKIVREYWKLDESIGSTEHNNLFQLLRNKGYTVINRQGNVTLDHQKLYEDLKAFYGDDLISRTFGDTLDAGMVLRIIRWQHLLPDRYILLQAMAGADTETVFSNEKIDDPLLDRIIEIKETGKFITNKQIAEALGIKIYELNTLVEYYGIEPFWILSNKRKYKSARHGLIRCLMDIKELNRVEAVSKDLGYNCVGSFALDCIRYVMNNNYYIK